MASNVVLDLQKARNQRRHMTRRDTYDRSTSLRAIAAPNIANERSQSISMREIAAVARYVVVGAVAAALLWLGYVGVNVAASHAEGVSAWLTSQSDGRFDSREIVVRSGDTLWGIAREHGPTGIDVRETVDWIRRNNGLSDATVYPGQVLIVPAMPK